MIENFLKYFSTYNLRGKASKRCTAFLMNSRGMMVPEIRRIMAYGSGGQRSAVREIFNSKVSRGGFCVTNTCNSSVLSLCAFKCSSSSETAP